MSPGELFNGLDSQHGSPPASVPMPQDPHPIGACTISVHFAPVVQSDGAMQRTISNMADRRCFRMLFTAGTISA